MCTVFWDAEDILLIGYMPHKVTVIGVYYADLLHKLRVAIAQKRQGKLTKVPLLLHDNASAYRSHVWQATVPECRFEEMRHRAVAAGPAGPAAAGPMLRRIYNKKLSYRRETARQLHTSFSAHSLIVHFTEHRICFTTI